LRRRGKQDGVADAALHHAGEGDDAEALEASMIENMLRQNPDQVTQWESYTRLVKEGRSVEDIAATFALTEVQVKRILALGNLLPRIREPSAPRKSTRPRVKHLTLGDQGAAKGVAGAVRGCTIGYAPRDTVESVAVRRRVHINQRRRCSTLPPFTASIVKDLFER
jgi:ParB family chromosome partitioning protein